VPVSWRPPRRIRAVAIGVIRRGDELLVYEAQDPTEDKTFYRPLGGEIDFGEPAADALAREFREELGVELEGVRYLETLENIYEYDAHPGHELIRIYEARLSPRSLYERSHWEIQIGNGGTCRVLWKRLDDFDDNPLYPEGLRELLRA
jgi:8-oxo-dGTP pyrophosphatase MutT (NUDIX family)